MIKETLQALGMTKNEIEVYLALLKSGSLSVNKIGEKSALHRQVCYDALDRLLEKGFVSYIVQDNKKYFQALKPDKILDYLEEKRETVREILPELNKLTTLPREDTFIEVVKGKNVIRTILRDVISTLKGTKQSLMMLGVDETKFMEEDKIAIQQYLRDLKRFKIKERLVIEEGAKLTFPGEQSEYKKIKKEYFNPNPLYIYNGKIAQIIWGNPLHAIIISNKEVFDANRKYFEMLWKLAKK
jgi:sugar-specific transcriptional regulator TrmB